MFAISGMQDQRHVRLVSLPVCRRTELHLNGYELGRLAASG